MQLSRAVSIASIAVGALLYLGAVTGLLFAKPTPATDVGAISTAAVFILGGLAGLALRPRAA